jgi:hypothetical protein
MPLSLQTQINNYATWYPDSMHTVACYSLYRSALLEFLWFKQWSDIIKRLVL